MSLTQETRGLILPHVILTQETRGPYLRRLLGEHGSNDESDSVNQNTPFEAARAFFKKQKILKS